MQMYIVRHGESTGTTQKRYGDFPLSDRGRSQAARLARQLGDVPFTHVYSSPLERAQQTMQIIINGRNVQPALLDGLREVNIGAFDQLTFEQAHARYPWFFAQSRAHPTPDFGWPDGETTAQAFDRAKQTWATLWGKHQKRDDILLVVSHTFYLNLFLLAVLGLPFPNRFTFKVELGGCVHVAAEDGLPPWLVFDSA